MDFQYKYTKLLTRGNRFWIQYKSGLIYPISKKRFYDIVVRYPTVPVDNLNKKNKKSIQWI